MRLKIKLLVSVIGGMAVSGIGIGLMALGGWGPCGPASQISSIGGWLVVVPSLCLFHLFPGLEAFVSRFILDFVFVTLFSTVVWGLLIFGILSLWTLCRRRRNYEG